MNVRTLGLTLVVLVGATAVTIPADAQKKPKPPKPYTLPGPVSITAKPNPVTFSTPVTISGRVQDAKAGVSVTILRRTLPATTFTGTGTVKTTKNGSYSFTHRPTANTYYRAVSAQQPPKQSGDLLVKVRTLVGLRVSDATPRAGSRVRFSGIVRPRHNGRTVQIQRRSPSGRWVTIARPRLRTLDAKSSRYSRTLRVRSSGTYRARVLGHSDHAMGVSRERSLVTH